MGLGRDGRGRAVVGVRGGCRRRAVESFGCRPLASPTLCSALRVCAAAGTSETGRDRGAVCRGEGEGRGGEGRGDELDSTQTEVQEAQEAQEAGQRLNFELHLHTPHLHPPPRLLLSSVACCHCWQCCSPPEGGRRRLALHQLCAVLWVQCIATCSPPRECACVCVCVSQQCRGLEWSQPLSLLPALLIALP